MTGFGRASGHAAGVAWAWEIKSVNGRGLDVRWRLPNGWDELEGDGKPVLAKALTRGSITASLTLKSEAGAADLVDADGLASALALIERLVREHRLAAPSAAEVLALPGVMGGRGDQDDAARTTLKSALLGGLSAALVVLCDSRRAEGARLGSVIADLLARIDTARAEAERLAAAQPRLLNDKLAQRLSELLGSASTVDPDRLAQEVALLALKADVREELDRLTAHIAAAQALLAKPEPVGRAFDFLAQEFNREANTLCSKAATTELTRLGLELKSLIDQLREQVQNLE
jgi:uncharacterized protein (TIGR00255 family)